MEDKDTSLFVRCDNPACKSGLLDPDYLHSTVKGDFCDHCCIHLGSMSCQLCWPDFGDD